MRLALALALTGCLWAAQVAPAERTNCSNLESALEELGSAQGITTLNEHYRLSTSELEWSSRCQQMLDALKSLKRYNRDCLSGLTQQVFAAILRTRAQMTEASCQPGSDEFRGALGATKCIKLHAFEAVREAERRNILGSQVLHDAQMQDAHLRLRRSCCAVLASKDFFMAAVRPKCGQFEQVYAQYADSYSSEAFGLICREADKLQCDRLEPLRTEGVEVKYKFFLSPMLKLIKSMDQL